MEKVNETLKVRGNATINIKTGDFNFNPYGEGTPTKEIIKTIGKSQLYRTTSTTQPKLCAHLMCPNDDPDPWSTFDDQLTKFMKGFRRSAPQLPPRKRDRVLWDEEGVKIWARSDKGVVEISLTLPIGEGSLEKQALSKFQKLYQCFSTNKEYLRKLSLARKKN